MCVKSKVEPLLKAFREVIEEFYGTNPQKSESYGRVVNTRQFDRLKKMLDATDPNTIIVGGQTDRDDLFISPTIVYPADANTSPLMQQEIFGPILPVIPVENTDEAINIVNSR